VEQARAQLGFEACQSAADQHRRRAQLTSRSRQAADRRNGAKQSHICEIHILTISDILLIVYPIFCGPPAKAKSSSNEHVILRLGARSTPFDGFGGLDNGH
jgi:hypothetical protein